MNVELLILLYKKSYIAACCRHAICISEKLVTLLDNIFSKTLSAVRMNGELTEWFRVYSGSKTRI